MTRVLVAYASRHGSTEAVARTIAMRLRGKGDHVDVRAAAIPTDPGAYDAVVLGGSLYMGRLHADARRFLVRNRAALGSMPFAVFALGPLSMDDADGSRNQLALALERAEVEPSVVEIFGGVIDPKKLRFPFSHMRESDARDWTAIESWADRLAALFELEQATAGVV